MQQLPIMANVKLFRVTEFAESVFQSPLAHRTSPHPFWVMLAVALWIGTVGHWPLWETMLTDSGAANPVMALVLATQITLGALLWLALFGWRWSLKPAIAVLLFWAALGSCAMWLQRSAGEAVALSPGDLLRFLTKSENWARLQSWQCVATLLVVALIPAILVWRGRIRRIPLLQRWAMVALLLVACYALLTALSGYFSHSLPSPMDPLSIWRALAGPPASAP